MITVWQYDDLWEDGYRFNDLVTKRYCYVDRKFASNKHEALEMLVTAYKFIPKIEGTSKPIKKAEYITDPTCVVIVENN